ncbi:MAG: protein from nitrogen regulatory protein P-II (GLNB) family, ortholog YAAQ B. subtilis [uncultured Chloroflexia bacterium]|uniref:Protein from nitrogen regulatory protein P-II (GLNB) family, ortholog YAAQ B. subtilis n=1 Tax=uncultured Chloroflexia bacterium TaxID=1672391 RepID=A0A6J4H1W0_9CHLR|nr:MAG: protein from nitrogen regulatory protein P-II (GLNB) family, ortholog YAAQ B. subtilis [uncultured Chloroflexia bacterium]
MKLLIAVIQRQDEAGLIKALNAQRIGVTRIGSQGGFLREGNITLFIVIEDSRLEDVLQLVRTHCYTRTKFVAPLPPIAESGEFYPSTPIEVQVGGASVFVVRVAEQARL